MPSASPDCTRTSTSRERTASPASRPNTALGRVRDKLKRTLTGDEGLAPEQKERKKREELERDEWCRREKHYRELDQTKGDYEEFLEGDQVVREYGDGSCVVRDLSPEEKEEFDKKRSPGLLKLALSRSRSRSPR
ncbi:hypothetical protein NBRC10513v2_007390 [Rhodotorula toruloides]|uniref:Uncharacterized protein n=1 Tax=Rhodotorula toruloides TaxID=5286 RepID=A0A0K3CQ83_RHOTO